MPQKLLNCPDIRSALQQVRCKTVPERVAPDILCPVHRRLVQNLITSLI